MVSGKWRAAGYKGPRGFLVQQFIRQFHHYPNNCVARLLVVPSCLLHLRLPPKAVQQGVSTRRARRQVCVGGIFRKSSWWHRSVLGSTDVRACFVAWSYYCSSWGGFSSGGVLFPLPAVVALVVAQKPRILHQRHFSRRQNPGDKFQKHP